MGDNKGVSESYSVVDLDTGDKFGRYDDTERARTKALQYMKMFNAPNTAIVDTDTDKPLYRVRTTGNLEKAKDVSDEYDMYLDESVVKSKAKSNLEKFKSKFANHYLGLNDMEVEEFDDGYSVNLTKGNKGLLHNITFWNDGSIESSLSGNNGGYHTYNSFKDFMRDNKDWLKESVEKHDTLNQKIFNGDELDPEVKDKLLEIVDRFKYNLEENDIKLDIKDVRIIGSNASYNYTDKSDIDLHIFADLSVYPDQEMLAQKVYDAYKALWNTKFDPIIRGHEVEIYVEPYTGD